MRTHISLIVSLAFLLTFSHAPYAFAEFLYFTEVFSPTFLDGRVQRIRTDGTELLNLKEVDDGLRGIAIDESAAELYWTNVESDTIVKFSSSKQTPQVVVSTGLAFPQDLVIDQNGGTLIWMDSLFDHIESADLDGTNRNVLASGVVGAAVTIDAVNEKIYAENRMTAEIGEILRMNYDGSALETVISNVPTASSIAIDPSSETIFWTSAAGLANGDGGVYRARFDGSGFEEIFLDTTFPNTNTSAATIDLANDVLYFAQEGEPNRSTIYRINFDGSNPTLIASGFGNIPHMVFSSVEIVPEPNGIVLLGIALAMLPFSRRRF